MPVAALPMYDWPDVRAATDALWRTIAERLGAGGIAAPERLSRQEPAEALWRDPELVLAQTCGLPYVTRLRGTVRLVATPCYDVEGCAAGDYSSVFLARAGDPATAVAEFAGRRAAVNATDSQSGYAALGAMIAAHGPLATFFAARVETGGHRASMEAVRDGHADCCAVDAVCWALARRYRPELARALKPIAWSEPMPGLPLITAAARSDEEVAALRRALSEALADQASAKACAALFLIGIAILPESAYDRLLA